MKSTLSCRRRLILGMSIEDARSKFDSPESRAALRLAHERHNQGLYHELTLAQRQRNKLPAEWKCHLVRHTKPSVKGFQAYIKSAPEDFVVREIWQMEEEAKKKLINNNNNNNNNMESLNATDTGIGNSSNESKTLNMNGIDEMEALLLPTIMEENSNSISSQEGGESNTIKTTENEEASVKDNSSLTLEVTPYSTPTHLGREILKENETYVNHRTVVLTELSRVAETLGSDVWEQLVERRENGTLLPNRHTSVVDKLIDNAKEAKDKGYTSLSSSSHLLEPLILSMNVCGKKDKQLLEAFRSPLLCLPAEENNISLSLWVAGNIIEKNELAEEFPYHIAKHAEPEIGEDGLPIPSGRLPKANIEVYFSPELYQLKQTIGDDGILALRRFIGRAMKRQHNPLPTASSILLNMGENQQEECGLSTGETTQIPWLHIIKAKVASSTGTVLEVTSDETPTESVLKEAIHLVWRTWGHLIKDLHIYGDLDFMYVSVHPRVELPIGGKKEDKKVNNILIKEENTLKGTSDIIESKQQSQPQEQGVSLIRSMGDAVDGLIGRDNSIWSGFKPRRSQAKNILFPTDFVVVECLLEKKGLPHRLVVEDVVETLTELQRQAMELQRLAVVIEDNNNNNNNNEKEDGNTGRQGSTPIIRPVMYAPKVTVSHAGIIDAAAHGFQRIRIRGSCLAHVEALARALESGQHLTNRESLILTDINSSKSKNNNNNGSGTTLQLPPNLSFSATHSDTQNHIMERQLLGHRIPLNYSAQRLGNGRFRPHQNIRPMQGMIADKEEREFWSTHYYKISDVRLIFHERVSATDVENPSGWSPTLKEQLLSLSQRRQSKQQGEDGSEINIDGNEDSEETSTRGKKSLKKKKLKSKKAITSALEEIIATVSPEKIFEYLCVDMEVESASYDFRIGDNDGYSYRVKLRRIPQSHLPLVKPAMLSLKEKGFINYFGPQRFASYTKHNMHPGLHLLKGEFRAAASIIVQQFSMDTDIASEKRRNGGSGANFSKMYHSKGMGFHLPDFNRSMNPSSSSSSFISNNRNGRRSIAEHGTALQATLDNALQAVALLGDDEIDNNGNKIGEKQQQEEDDIISIDPCAEAFLRVVGPKACCMLVYEFLAFVWNDIVNQRLQRYGTFAILPGDLVRTNPLASPHSEEYGKVVYASKKDIEKGKYTYTDVVLPIPGVGIQLPDNHTTDLYIVTLKRMGILFNPETKQWDIFRRRSSFGLEDALNNINGVAGGSSPYRQFSSSSFALMEEELGSSTTIVEPIDDCDADAGDENNLNKTSSISSLSSTTTVMGDASQLRSDLRQAEIPGNPLGVNIFGFYRHIIINPSPTLDWKVQVGHSGDPHQRWALGVRRAFIQTDRDITVGSKFNNNNNNNNNNQQYHHQQPQLFLGKTKSNSGGDMSRRHSRNLPPIPYWLPQKSEGCLDLSFELPSCVYPSMLLREITKSDVNSPETVNLDRPLLDTRAKSWSDLSADQQTLYRKHLAQKRQKLFTNAPRAINIALLHQHIFRTGGMRFSLLPSMRSYDNVSK